MTGKAHPPGAPGPRRRWLLRGLALLLLGCGLSALDRVALWLWYRPVYDDVVLPDPGPAGRLRSKTFLRSVPDPWLNSRTLGGIRLRMRTFNMMSGGWLRYDIETNRLGFRGPELARPKPAGTLRLVSMGGSSTFAQGVRTGEAYIFQLAAALQRRLPGRRVEAVNAGVQGYGSPHGYRLYQLAVRDLQPDLLVVAYDVNDGMTPYPASEVAGWPPPGDLLEMRVTDAMPPGPQDALDRMEQGEEVTLAHRLLPWLQKSGLFLSFQYGWSWGVFLLREGWPSPPPLLPTPDPPQQGARAGCPVPHVFGAVARPGDRCVQEYRHNLQALDILARRDRVPVIYLSIPLEGFGDLRSAYPYTVVMKNLARPPDRRHVDPTESFCRHSLQQVMIDFSHPTPLGHSLLARALEQPALELLGIR